MTPPPGLPRWSDDWPARTHVTAPPLRLHRACPGGATSDRLEREMRRRRPSNDNAIQPASRRSTGASPVEAGHISFRF